MGLSWKRGGRNQGAANGQTDAETQAMGTVAERAIDEMKDGAVEDWDRPAYLRRGRAASEALGADAPPPAVVQALLNYPAEVKREVPAAGEWTRTAPTTVGWYGMRRPWWPYTEWPDATEIVRVIKHGERLVLAGSGRRWVTTLPHEWLGPIVLPN